MAIRSRVWRRIQEEPAEAADPETLGLLASIGIETGTPFAPDVRMKKILAEAAAVGQATVRALAYRCRLKDAFCFFYATGITPAMAIQRVGAGAWRSTLTRLLTRNFGPTPPPGKESNWVQTWPGKGGTVILRLYGPLQPFFDRTWRPGGIEAR